MEDALSIGTKGNPIARYKEVKDLENNGVTYHLEYTFDDAMKYTTHGVMINALHGSIFRICMYMILTDMKQFR